MQNLHWTPNLRTAVAAALLLAGASAWMLRYTLRLAQPQRTY